MFTLIHALLGQVIGANVNSITLLIICSLIGHFLLDSIPHWDGYFNKKNFQRTGRAKIEKATFYLRALDITATILLIAFLFHSNRYDSSYVALGALIAVLPDFAKIGYLTKLKEKKSYMNYLKFHGKIQTDSTLKTSLFIQAITIIVLLLFYF